MRLCIRHSAATLLPCLNLRLWSLNKKIHGSLMLAQNSPSDGNFTYPRNVR